MCLTDPHLTVPEHGRLLGNICNIKVAQRVMDRSMLGISLVDQVPNLEIRR